MKTFAVFCVLVAVVIAGPVKHFDYRKAEIEGRITGGTVAAPHQFPYQVGLFLQSKTSTGATITQWCGGSLISNRVVLTAANCLRGVFEATVYLGSQGMLEKNEGGVEQVVTSQEFIVHPEYDPLTSVNDIALITLRTEVVLNENIKTVNLPRLNQVQSTLENKVAVVTGWGNVGDNKEVSWDNLLYANVRILPDADCKKTYPHSFNSTHVCVSGDNHKSVCSGDSGGPLVIAEADGSNTVVGITSFGRMAGCELGYPTVFTRVTSYLDWIAKNAGVVPKRI